MMPKRTPFARCLSLAEASCLAAAVLLSSAEARAQRIEPRLSDGVVTPSHSVAATDDATAIFVNPSNIAFGPGPEARFTIIHTGDDAPLALRGYALDFALPVWILGTGLRIDWMNPPSSAPPPLSMSGVAQRYAWIRWGNAVRLGDFASIGTTLAWSTATTTELDGFFSATSSLTLRPNRFATAAVVARDWNKPRNDSGRELDRSVDLGASFRPLSGHKQLEIGLEGSYRAGPGKWVPSANLGVGLPYLGRLRLGAQALDIGRGQYLASALLDLNIGNMQITGGPLFGSALTTDDTGFVLGAAVRTFQETREVPMPARVARLRFEATPDEREHVRLLRTLWHMAEDREIAGVLLELRTQPAPSLAHAEEIVDALRLLKRRGKKVLCHLEDAGGRELYACSEADRIAVNPAGGVRFAGIASRWFYIGGLLDKIGVRADFVRIGSHKLAPELLTHGPSDVGRVDHRELLSQTEDAFIEQLSRGRKMTHAKARQAVARGPFIATEARDARLVDDLVYDDEIERFVEEAMGRPVAVVDYERSETAPDYWREPSKIAIVYLWGDMIDGMSRKIPIIGMRLAGSYTITKALKQAREDSSIQAVVFRVETPGGSSLASDLILRELTLTAKKKPVVVSMGAKAASGGYYASVAGGEIFANRTTMTGSIGIFYGKVDVSGLLDKLGVRTVGLETAPRADAESLFRPFTDDERTELGKKVKQFYDLFVGRVAEGRSMSAAEVHAVAQGKVWTGKQALEHRLVDHIGGLRQALARARRLAKLPADAPIVELPDETPTLFERALEYAGVPTLGAEAGAQWMPPPMLETARALAPFVVLESHKPLALMEWAIPEP